MTSTLAISAHLVTPPTKPTNDLVENEFFAAHFASPL